MDYLYNPSRDIQAVSQVCLPTLGMILESGEVPQDSGELLYNDVENPDAVIGLMRDNFDIADASRIAEAVSVETPAPAPAPSPEPTPAPAPAPAGDK